MELILDSAELTAFKDIINRIFSFSNKGKITELKIAMAYNHSGEHVDEFWKQVIGAEIATEFFFLCNEGTDVVDILAMSKDKELINWYPIYNNFHCKIIYAEGVGIYIGSANLTNKAIMNNFEAGVWIAYEDFTPEYKKELEDYFELLEKSSYDSNAISDKVQFIQLYCDFRQEIAKEIDKKENCNRAIAGEFKKIFPNINTNKKTFNGKKQDKQYHDIQYYKIGCRWSEEGYKHTEINDIFLKSQVVFVGEEDKHKRTQLLKMKTGDRIGITSGIYLVAVAKLTSDAATLGELDVKIENKKGVFNMEDHANHAIGARAKVYSLLELNEQPAPRFWFRKFCKINNAEKKQIIDNLLKQFTQE